MIKKFLIFLTINYQLSTINCFSGTLDKVIVIVNGETITQGELDTAVSGALENVKTKSKGEELDKIPKVNRKEILDRMIEEKLILSEAKKMDIKAEDAEIETRLREVKSKFDSEQDFNEALKDDDITLSELKQRYADQIKIAKLIEAEVKKKVVVSPSEIAQYYKLHQEKFKEPQQVKLKNILIRPDKDLKDEDAQALAEKILGFLKAGENFDELAIKYSKGPNADMGGDLGFVKRGEMLKEIDNVVFNLNPGEVSNVIKTQFGYHIFKVEQMLPERIKEINKARDDIEKILFFEKGKQRYKELIEELKKNAYISYRN